MPKYSQSKVCTLVHIGFKIFQEKGISPDKLLRYLDHCYEDTGWAIPGICMPWRYWLGKKCFHPKKSKIDNGFFAKYVRQQKETINTIHPTHSVSFRGKIPAFGIYNHENSSSPCGNGSPWEFFCQNNSRIILAGCDESSLTITHCAEEQIHPKERLSMYKGIFNEQSRIRKNINLHSPYIRHGQGRQDLANLLKRNKDFYDTTLLGIPARVYFAEPIHLKMLNICKKNPGQKKNLLFWLGILLTKKLKLFLS